MRRARHVGGVYVRRQFRFLGDRLSVFRMATLSVRPFVISAGPEAAAPSVATVPRSSAMGSSSNESSSGVAGRADTIVWFTPTASGASVRSFDPRRQRDSLRSGGSYRGAGRRIADVGHTDGGHMPGAAAAMAAL